MPTLVTSVQTAWTGGASLTSPSLTVDAGDVLLVAAATGSNSTSLSTPTATGLTFTLVKSASAASNAAAYVWQATASATATLTVGVARSAGSSSWGFSVLQYRGAQVGASASTTATSAPSLAVTTTAAGSHLVWVHGDWAGVSGTPTWRTVSSVSAVPIANGTTGASTRFYVGTWSGVGAIGSKTAGVSAPSGQTWAGVVVEVVDVPFLVLAGSGSVVTSATGGTIALRQVTGSAQVATSAVGSVGRHINSASVITSAIGLATAAPPAWRAGARSESVALRMFSLDGADLGELPFEDISLDGSINADIRWTGRLTWSGVAAAMPDWRTITVQPWYTVEGGGSWPLGVYLCRSAAVAWSDTVPARVDVTLYDVTARLSSDFTSLAAPLSFPAGTVITDTVVARLTATGVTRHAITPSTKVLGAPVVCDTGDSEAKVVNRLLAAAGYWAVYTDPYGVAQGAPYTDPSQRAVSWRFPESGDASVSGSTWNTEMDDFAIPNRLAAISRTTDAAPTPLKAEASLDVLAPWSPHTATKRGVQVWGQTLRDVDAADLPALQARVNQALLSTATPSETLTITHPWLDTVRLSDVVLFQHQGAWQRYVVEKQSLTIGPGMPVRTTARRAG